jgi:hypothetical protein
VREAAVGDGDLEAGAHAERDERAVARVEAADGAQDVHPLVPEPQKVAEHGHDGRTRRQAAAVGMGEQEEGQEQQQQQQSDEERPCELHVCLLACLLVYGWSCGDC